MAGRPAGFYLAGPRAILRGQLARPAPDLHGSGDVFQQPRAQRQELRTQLAADLRLNGLGNANAAGRRDGFQSRGNVDAIAMQLAACINDVGEIDADPVGESSAPAGGRVQTGNAALEFDGKLHSLQNAAEGDECAVAQQAEDAPTAASQRGLDDCGANLVECG